MKDARYLIRQRPPRPVSTVDAAALLGEVRALLAPISARAINLRVSSRAIEWDLFLPVSEAPETALKRVAELGELLTCKRLDVVPPVVVAADRVAEARQLFNEERFWEVHEVLEDLWKERSGAEKQLIQGLILAAAALVHRQKDERTVVKPMLKDALSRLVGQPDTYFGWDIAAFRAAVEALARSSAASLPKV